MNRLLMVAWLGILACGGEKGTPSKTAADVEAGPPPSAPDAALSEADAPGNNEPADSPDDPAASSSLEAESGGGDTASSLPKAKGASQEGAAESDPPGAPPRPLAATETESLLRITVVTDKDEVIPGVIITVENSKGQKFISRESDENGRLELVVPKGDTYTARFVSLSENEVVKQIPMPNKPFITAEFKLIHTPPTEKSFVLHGVVFDTNKWDLKPESYPNLENLLEYMTLKKTARIRLEGHTDNVGDFQSNMILSQRRAEAVRQYLVKKGIAASRMEAKGYGETKPVASNDTEEGRQTNRRTVVTILGK